MEYPRAASYAIGTPAASNSVNTTMFFNKTSLFRFNIWQFIRNKLVYKYHVTVVFRGNLAFLVTFFAE